jgi:signal transduction histidine kinase
MRSMVGTLRRNGEPEYSPLRGASDIVHLANRPGDQPHVDVELVGDLDRLRPSIDAALYRLAQESITNAIRHARHATHIRVTVDSGDDCVQLTVRDDGDAAPGQRVASGYGLIGMTERAALLGGTLDAGPDREADRGWTVHAVLPKRAGSS